MKIMSLNVNKERLKNYIEGSGQYCPRCDSDMILSPVIERESMNQIHLDSGEIFKGAICVACDLRWKDVFCIVGIEVINSDGKLVGDLHYRQNYSRG